MYEKIAKNARDAIIGFDFSHKVTFHNKAASHIFGYDNKELLGVNHDKLLPKYSDWTFEKIVESVLLDEELPPFFTTLSDSHHNRFEVSAQYSPIREEGDKIIGISLVIRKIAEFEKVRGRMQAILETAPDAMVIANQTGQIVLVNTQMEKLFGYKKEELVGQEVEMLMPEKYVKGHEVHRKNYMKQPKTRSMGLGMELSGKRKDGTTFPIEISLSPLQIDESLFVSAAIRDVTIQKKSENKFKSLLESAPDAIVIVGVGGVIQMVNTQVENIFGYTRDELIGKKIETLIPERYRKKHPEHVRGFMSNPKARPMGAGLELYGLRKNGEEFPVEISLSPLETEEGMLVSSAIRDITDRKTQEEALKEYNIELEKKNKELEQFTHVAAHDLQEPLRTIRGFAEMLNEKYQTHFNPDDRKHMDFIHAATSRMSQLIQGLLDYSRIGTRINYTKVDCNKILSEVQEDLELIIANTQADLVVENLPVVYGDEVNIRAIFQNLISNAIKFRKADVQPVIRVSSEKDGNYWKFCIEDNGIGIDKKFENKIFVIFHRLHNREKYEGTGVGLTHCKKIIELLGGKIWLDSELGVGSKFYFTLPGTKNPVV